MGHEDGGEALEEARNEDSDSAISESASRDAVEGTSTLLGTYRVDVRCAISISLVRCHRFVCGIKIGGRMCRHRRHVLKLTTPHHLTTQCTTYRSNPPSPRWHQVRANANSDSPNQPPSFSPHLSDVFSPLDKLPSETEHALQIALIGVEVRAPLEPVCEVRFYRFNERSGGGTGTQRPTSPAEDVVESR
ncbi:hypothetical protein HYDPIDRAFT_107849 [Hydnomerulius pinastri MD-312]|nr:hypothetical protein HYDPIDRAFT_107849 [Hydnomerulius pinastri MD-312]